jgi:hypothetical protein
MGRVGHHAAVSWFRGAIAKLFGESSTALITGGAYKHRSGGKAMHVRDYCDNVSAELTGWKVKMYDVMSKLEKVPSGDKEKVQPYLNDIHMILASLNDRIAQLRTECPVSWDPQKKEVDEVLGKIKNRWDEVSANIPW